MHGYDFDFSIIGTQQKLLKNRKTKNVLKKKDKRIYLSEKGLISSMIIIIMNEQI